MHHLRAFGTIFLILGFALLSFGCATGKPASGNYQTVTGETGITAEAVPQGICVTFNNIPKETNRLFVMFQHWVDNDHPESTHGIIGSYSDITGITLEQVKQTGRVIFPFVKAGQMYTISACFENEKGQVITGVPDWIYAECAASAGIYFNEGPTLALNSANTGVTLSCEPVFPEEVQFAPDKYVYAVKLDLSEQGSLGYSDRSAALHWDFEPNMTFDLKNGEHLQSGDYSAYVTVYRNINYDNVTWTVEIAKTPEFVYSLN